MGTLSDFFVGTKKQARAVRATGPKGEGVLQLTGIDPVMIAELAEVLGVTKDQLAWLGEGFTMVAGSKEGPWVHDLGSLVEALAALDERGVKRAATAWSKAESTSALDRKACGDVLTGLARLGRHARERKQSLFVWMSL